MKCSRCKYLYYPECESNYTSCRIFGDDTPDEYMRKDGEGCICNGKQLAKVYRENEKAWLEDKKAFVEWFEKNELNKE